MNVGVCLHAGRAESHGLLLVLPEAFFCNTRTEPVQIELQKVAVSEVLVPVCKMRFHACLVGTYCRTAQLCSDGPFYKQVCVSQHDANKVSKLNLAGFC